MPREKRFNIKRKKNVLPAVICRRFFQWSKNLVEDFLFLSRFLEQPLLLADKLFFSFL